MRTRFINCEACQTEGRILTCDGGPDEVDHGVCPTCKGERMVEVEVQSITLEDLEADISADVECPSCRNWRDDCRLCGGSGQVTEQQMRDFGAEP